MAEKSFGAKKIKLDGSGTPTIQSPSTLNLDAVTVGISTNLTVGGTASITGNLTSTGEIQCLNKVESGSGQDLLLNANGANRDVKIQVNDVNMLYVKGSNSNIGIGIDSPDSLLHLEGSGSDAKIKLQRTGTTIGGSINTRDESGDKGLTYIAKDGNSGVPAHVFQTDAGSGATERLRIATNGLVTVNRDGVGGRIDATAGDASIKILDGNGRSSIKVSDPGSGSSYEWELTTAGNFKAPDGKGIDFGATTDATTSPSETLADYERGTWVPHFYKGSGNSQPSYSWRYGQYVRIGDFVHITFSMGLTGETDSYSECWIGNLPYSYTLSGGHFTYHLIHGYSWQSGYGDDGSQARLYLGPSSNNNGTKAQIFQGLNKGAAGDGTIGSGQRFAMNFTYPIA